MVGGYYVFGIDSASPEKRELLLRYMVALARRGYYPLGVYP